MQLGSDLDSTDVRNFQRTSFCVQKLWSMVFPVPFPNEKTNYGA